jgi:hypothetical protein
VNLLKLYDVRFNLTKIWGNVFTGIELETKAFDGIVHFDGWEVRQGLI